LNPLVLDSSVTLAWFMPDEQNPEANALLDRVIENGAIVPGIWHLEVGNALLSGLRRQRISLVRRMDAFVQLARLPISVDQETTARSWDDTLILADRFQLTLYDASYLELAHRRGLPLASFDRELRTAADQFEVELA
jgi:predicted nucleic acid-binding protein